MLDRRHCLEEITRELRIYDAVSIIFFSEGRFDKTRVEPVEIKFKVPNELGGRVELFAGYLSKRFALEKIPCTASLSGCLYSGSKKEYTYRIEKTAPLTLLEYERYTAEALQKILEIVKERIHGKK
jgi:hypothetical protein